jgi:hypothetical protein
VLQAANLAIFDQHSDLRGGTGLCGGGQLLASHGAHSVPLLGHRTVFRDTFLVVLAGE